MSYKKRRIEFRELVDAGDWKVKVYTISKSGRFDHKNIFKNMLKELPGWLELNTSFAPNEDKVAFLILHSATEGVFSIINWWVGKNMLNTHVFLTPFNQPESFQKISGDGLGPCPWELEVIHHEGRSWLKHVLQPGSNRNLEHYLRDVINTDL
jgi:hypothetical protein